MAFPLPTCFLNLGELLFFLCLLFTHKRKIESDSPPWMIVGERVPHKNAIEHFPIEHVTLMRLDIQLAAQGGCRCSLPHHGSSLVMRLQCSWEEVFSFHEQSSCACGFVVSSAREHRRRWCRLGFQHVALRFRLPGSRPCFTIVYFFKEYFY